MTWQEILEHPSLKNLPFKIETNEFGQIVLSRENYLHGVYQSCMARTIGAFLPNGLASSETAIRTRKGIKVPDVAWSSYEFFEVHRDKLELSQAPELCVEILSPNNSSKEISGKRKLYFERGTIEVWTCDLNGVVKFYDANGELEASVFANGFPKQIEIETP